MEPLDLRITTKTLETMIDFPSAVYWDTSPNDDEFKKKHPLVSFVLATSWLLPYYLLFKKGMIESREIGIT